MNPEQAAKCVMLEVIDILTPVCGDLIIVGGWVPDLHYPDAQHVGSLDVDLVIKPTTESTKVRLKDHLESHQYRRSDKPEPTQFERSIPNTEKAVSVDLLSGQFFNGKKVRTVNVGGLEIGTLPGLDLAYRAFDEITLTGKGPDGIEREVKAKLVRPEAFVLIKAYPLQLRNKTKDAYDIAFVLNHHPNLSQLAGKMAPLTVDSAGEEAYEILRDYFSTVDSLGPVRAAEFASENGQDFEQTRQAAFQDAQHLLSTIAVLLPD